MGLRFSSPRLDGRLSRRWLLGAILPLILLCYFGSLILAARHFPQPYDWRYRVISNLLSPRDNPAYYRVPSVGIALAGLLTFPLADYCAERLRPTAARMANAGSWALRAGLIALVLAAIVVPQHVRPVLGLRHLHEIFARSSALGIVTGMLCFCGCAWKDRRGKTPGQLDRRLLPAWSSLVGLPLAGLLFSETLLLFARVSSTWGASLRAALRSTVFWHLGFWEWIGSAAVFAFLICAAWLLPAHAGVKEDFDRG